MHRFSCKTALVAAAMLCLSGLSAAAQSVYNRGNDTDPETLDQHKTSTISEANILRDLYEGLVAYDAKANVIPGAAVSHTISADGKVYTFKMRPNAKWSNGDPVKAGDFVFSLQRIMNPATGAKYATVLYPIKNAEKINKGSMKPEELGVRAIDDATLEITLEGPTPYFLQLLTHQTGYPVHPASVQKFGTDFVKPGNMVSNGAYTLAEFTPNDKIVLNKNPNFHDAANVKIDRVVFLPMQDRAACLRRFEAGEILSCSDVPTDQMAYMKQKLGGQLRTAPYLGTYYYAFNSSKAPFSDIRVRKALSLVIDREFLASDIWSDGMKPAYSFVPPGIDNYTKEPAYADFKDKSVIDRESEAKKLLTEAGFGPGKPLKVAIRYNTGGNHQRTATAIADMWKQIGVETQLLAVDGATHYAYLRDEGDFDIARAGWIADYSDPQNFLFLVLSDNKGFNYARYKNPEYDKLLKDAGAETDIPKRAAILKKAEEMFMRDLPFVPLMYYGSLSLVSSKLKGWEDNIQNAHATRWMSIQ